MTAEAKTDINIESGRGRVAKNAVTYFIGQILSWLTAILAVSIIPRRLGEGAYGELTVAGTTVLTVASILSLGVTDYLVKEVGRDRRQTERLARATLGLRLAFIPPMILIALFMLWTVQPNRSIWILGLLNILLASLIMVADPLRSVLAGWEDAKRVSVLDILLNAAPLLAIPFLAFGPVSLMTATLGMTFVVFLLRCRWVAQHIALTPVLDISLWKHLLRGGLPFVASTIIMQVYSFVSVFILRHFTDIPTVGVYSQAYKLFGTFLFIPTSLGMALMPSLSRIVEARPEEFRAMQMRVLGLLVVIGLPVTTSVVVLAYPVCHLLYGPAKYVGLPQALQIYALAIIPMYIVSIMYQFLVAQGRNGIWNLFLIASVGLYALCSVLLTPWTYHTFHNGVLGAVGATVIAEGASALCALILLRTNVFNGELVGRILRAMLATAGMALVMYLMRGWFVLFPAVLGLGTFGLLAWWLHVLLPDEQAKITQMVRSKLQR